MDLGMPLMARDGYELNQEALLKPSIENGILPAVEGLYIHQKPSVTAVILSHPHLDHYGLMNWVHKDIPVHVSRESKTLIEIGNVFYTANQRQEKLLEHCKTFEHWKPFSLGPFTITSYLIDHSAFGASSLLIEADGKRVFYTGDLRGHGRKRKLFESLISHPIANLDCLLMEGTTLGGEHDIGYQSEADVEDAMCEVFSAQKDATFIMASGSNIDRTVSIYKAAKKCRKTLVLDLYQFYLLNQLKKYSPGLPPHPKDQIRVLYLNPHAAPIREKLGESIFYQYAPRKIGWAVINAHRQDMILRIPLSAMSRAANNMMREKPLNEAKFIYSMWPGYMLNNPSYQAFCDSHGIPLIEIHTSGHAYLQDLKRLVAKLKPKAILPIHTLAGDSFKSYFPNVVRIDDEESFSLDGIRY
jgi:ribonuclease J